MLKIDALDRKILFELDMNARKSASEIARKSRSSKEVVNYRIKRLMQTGVIKGFAAIIDHSKLGYFSFRVYLKLRNISPEKETEIANYLIKNRHVWWFVTVDGPWDMDFVILVKNPFDFYSVWEEFALLYKKYILSHETVLYCHIHGFPKTYLISDENKEKGFLISEEIKDCNVDEIDMKILLLLAKNARTGTVAIARSIGMDARTVKARIKKLENEGVIIGYRAVIDFNKLGYGYYKVLFYLTDASRTEEMRAYAFSHPNIVFINKTIGGSDFELEMHTKSVEDFYSILNDFRKRFCGCIDHYYYFRVREEYKIIYYPS